MKRAINTLWILLLVLTMNAKNSYYYYNGNRVNLTLSDDSVSVYTETTTKQNSQLEYSSQTISLNEIKDIKNSSISSIEYIIMGDDNQSVKMSNRFYVQLFDSIADVSKLQVVARETKAIIVGHVPNIPDWYELVVHKSVINNSLGLSNYFYETGFFKSVDPGFIFHFSTSTACVSDSHFMSDQWGMNAINSCDAWDITKGSSNIKIAIIDKGVYRQHLEFSINQFTNLYDCNSRSASGYQTYDEHGTQVCGVIAADHNQARIAGVSPNCKIIPISYEIVDTNMVAADLASGFAWAVNHGADVINCSWGDHHHFTWLHSPILESEIQNALINGRDGKGCVVIFAAGNVSTFTLDYPAYVFPDIVTVGAIKSDNYRWTDISQGGSSYGYDLDVVAPGHNIYTSSISPWGTSAYISNTGTSLAAPHVSGIAALILSINPYLTQKEVAYIIESTARNVQPSNVSYNYYNYTTTEGRPNGKWDFEMGYGLVDAHAAVFKAQTTGIRGPKEMCGVAKYYLMKPSQAGESVSWSVHNGEVWNPFFSIIGPTNQDTVFVKYDDLRLDPIPGDSLPLFDNEKYLSVTISNGSTSKTYEKGLKRKQVVVPTVSASNSNTIWNGNTQRTFTVTNSTSVPDSLLQWTVKLTSYTQGSPSVPTIVTNYYYCRTLTYTAPNPPLLTGVTIDIYVTNLAYECGEVTSDTLHFTVRRHISLLANDSGDGEIEVIISDENEELQHMPSILGKVNYTLEMWHSIYGRIYTQPAQNTRESISTHNLPQGVYVVLLKENGNVIAQTKIKIK